MNIVSFLDSNAVSIRYPGIVFHEIHPLYGRYPPYRPCSNKKSVFRKHQKQTVMEKNNTCTPCEQNFRDEVDHLVDEVKGYTKKDHEQKKKEVDEAFGKGKEQESGR